MPVEIPKDVPKQGTVGDVNPDLVWTSCQRAERVSDLREMKLGAGGGAPGRHSDTVATFHTAIVGANQGIVTGGAEYGVILSCTNFRQCCPGRDHHTTSG